MVWCRRVAAWRAIPRSASRSATKSAGPIGAGDGSEAISRRPVQRSVPRAIACRGVDDEPISQAPNRSGSRSVGRSRQGAKQCLLARVLGPIGARRPVGEARSSDGCASWPALRTRTRSPAAARTTNRLLHRPDPSGGGRVAASMSMEPAAAETFKRSWNALQCERTAASREVSPPGRGCPSSGGMPPWLN